MTQPVNDPWSTPAPAASTAPPERGWTTDGMYAPEPEKESSLFAPRAERLPILFNKDHAPGTKIAFEVLTAPKDVHSTCHPDTRGTNGQRLKQYWVPDGKGKNVPGVEQYTNGRENDPVIDVVITGQTDQRDPSIAGDDGRRSWFIQGSLSAPKGHITGEPVMNAKLALRDAIELAREGGIVITKGAELVGKTVTVHRVRREDPSKQNSSWFWQARVTA